MWIESGDPEASAAQHRLGHDAGPERDEHEGAEELGRRFP